MTLGIGFGDTGQSHSYNKQCNQSQWVETYDTKTNSHYYLPGESKTMQNVADEEWPL